jgi:acyl-CoA reductase-like NAD-dependent aldehyde dehydrogenase
VRCQLSAFDRMKKVRIGYWNDPRAQMGPLVSRKQMDRVLGYLGKGRREAAKVLLQGGKTEVASKEGGFYVKPAILAGSPENVAGREEIFGPVPFLLKLKSEDEAVGLVNRSRSGPANSVWTQDMGRANRVAEALVAGNSWINAYNMFVHGAPCAGVNLGGLGGGMLGPNTLFDYLRDQSAVRPL